MDAWNRDDPTLLINILAPKAPPAMTTTTTEMTPAELADHTLASTLADRVTNATSELTLLCDTLAGIGPNPDVDGLTAEDKAEIELNLLATVQSMLAVLHLAGFDVKVAIDCLADALDGEETRTYRITNTSSGHCIGDYQATSPERAISAMLADAGCAPDVGADPDLDADELTIYQPTARADRPEIAPILPLRICVWASEVVAEYADETPDRYASLDDLCRELEMTAAELGKEIAR